MAKNSLPFLTGEESTFRFYSDGAAVYVPTKSWSVEQNATEIADGVNGEDRDRLDLKTNYYSASLECYMNDMELINAYIAQQTNDDAEEIPFTQVGGLQFIMRDGTKAAYKLVGMKMGPVSLASGGRTDRTMFTLKLRFKRWLPAQTF